MARKLSSACPEIVRHMVKGKPLFRRIQVHIHMPHARTADENGIRNDVLVSKKGAAARGLLTDAAVRAELDGNKTLHITNPNRQYRRAYGMMGSTTAFQDAKFKMSATVLDNLVKEKQRRAEAEEKRAEKRAKKLLVRFKAGTLDLMQELRFVDPLVLKYLKQAEGYTGLEITMLSKFDGKLRGRNAHEVVIDEVQSIAPALAALAEEHSVFVDTPADHPEKLIRDRGEETP